MQEGLGSLATRSIADPGYIAGGGIDPGMYGGGTFTSQDVQPTLEAYENIFGPSARDIKQDLQRFKRHGRWHLPDILKGPNQYLTDRIDGLITDAASSPFTSRILPYKYITNVDGKIKWNVWSFDEGLASRVPYESAARTLTQTKRNFAGYTIRQGMAIVLEHNFMMTEPGRENFRNQLRQLVGSIQLTNDLDVHVALVLAPSYEKHIRERYMVQDRSSAQTCREFVDMFGFVQKNQNALDILIEEAKATLRKWGSPMPDFLLCNSKLTFQLTMTPDATNYVTKGPDGAKRLRNGPDLPSYRGISIIHTRSFSLETGQLPRDLMRRRVRVAEYYRIPPNPDNYRRAFQLYNEERDTWATFTFMELLRHGYIANGDDGINMAQAGFGTFGTVQRALASMRAHAHADAPHAAPRLAGPFRNNDDASQWGRLKDFGQRLGSGQLLFRMVWDGEAITKNLIYVPGADPMMILSERVRDEARNNELTEYDQEVVKAYATAHSHPHSVEDVNMVILLAEAVARYPRDVPQFRNAAGRAGHAADWLPNAAMPPGYMDIPDNPGRAANAAAFFTKYQKAFAWNESKTAGGTLVDAQQAWNDKPYVPADAQSQLNPARFGLFNRLKVALHFRSFMRYGVPLTYMRADRQQAEDFRTGLPGYGHAAREALSPFSHWLRDRGAIYHPNHFFHAQDGMDLADFGDYIGYNLILTNEILTELLSATVDDQICEGTLLYSLVNNPLPAAKEALIVTFLTTAVAFLRAAGDVKTRASLTRHAHGDLIRLLRALDTRNVAGGAAGPIVNANYAQDYVWKWPYSRSSDDDVFARNPVGWVGSLQKDCPRLYQDLDVTEALVDNLVTATEELGGCPFTAALPGHDHPRPDPSAASARNFLRMLAWRLWSDQSVPMSAKYAKRGDWPIVPEIIGNALPTTRTVIGEGFYADGAWPNNPRWGDGAEAAKDAALREMTRHMEVVVVRPNIEHYMLGIVMGQGGESLGSTFWGQTELSCYDDSMHGIWGMSYKYNERAIVINERNLVRLWDIAYDGYVGGKDDTAVDWNDPDPDSRTSREAFVKATMDVSQPYRGPSTMVMVFDHKHASTSGGQLAADHAKHFRHNWPSPIVYYDRGDEGNKEAMPVDFDNVHVVAVQEFRVFNNTTYAHVYNKYKDFMPDFFDLHKIRKNAGLAAVENEAPSDSLAFQGTMRVLNAESGALIQEVNGSGHHGPDFIGVASLRAGKGYKINSQPTIQRLV